MIGNGDEVGKWVSDRVGGEWYAQGSIALGEEQGGKIIAGVIYDNYNKTSIRGSIAIDRLTRSFLKVLLDYPFNLLKVKCVIATTSSKNHKSLRFINKLGFKQVGLIRDAMPDGDMVIFRLDKEDCSKFME